MKTKNKVLASESVEDAKDAALASIDFLEQAKAFAQLNDILVEVSCILSGLRKKYRRKK